MPFFVNLVLFSCYLLIDFHEEKLTAFGVVANIVNLVYFFYLLLESGRKYKTRKLIKYENRLITYCWKALDGTALAAAFLDP